MMLTIQPATQLLSKQIKFLKKLLLFMNAASSNLKSKLNQWGYKVIIQCVSEFKKADGTNKCLVLNI